MLDERNQKIAQIDKKRIKLEFYLQQAKKREALTKLEAMEELDRYKEIFTTKIFKDD